MNEIFEWSCESILKLKYSVIQTEQSLSHNDKKGKQSIMQMRIITHYSVMNFIINSGYQ